MSEEASSKADSLRVQLSELNQRGRHYTSQIWQVPFAYVGILVVAASQLIDEGPAPLMVVLLAGIVFGTAVLIHLTTMVNGAKRAVEHIRKVEAELGLDATVQHRPLWYAGPLFGIVVVAIAACLLGAGYYACQMG